MPKVKIAPLCKKFLAGEDARDDWDQDAFDEELRALRHVAQSVHVWFMDEDDDRKESTAAMLRAHDRLERISKGTK